MSSVKSILATYRAKSQTEREKGSYFEELIRTYFRNEPRFADLYSDVWLFADWAKAHGFSAKDTGIDLVAKTHGTEEFHAIQCKCYAEDYRVRKAYIDSFFTASGQKPFTLRYIVTTTNDWSENAENSLHSQTPPVYKIDLHDLETSQIDWAKYQPSAAPTLKPKKELRPHQTSAKGKVTHGLAAADRGKLIMACGTGKTFTSLKIAEEVAGKDKRVLFLVPSLNLLSQTLTEWTQETATPLHSFAVCSDVEVGKKRNKDEDIVETFAHELRYPATTDAKRLAVEMAKRHDGQHMSVVFSTYHSLDVISRAQHLHGLPPFDLVICDEAHRTTGASFEGDQESNFVKIHDNAFIKAAKRLYMTAINIEAVYHSIMKDPGATSPALGRPGGAQSSDGTEPRAMPWAGMDQALGLEDGIPASSCSAFNSANSAARTAQNALHSPAPTGQTIPAQGNALGPDDKKNPSPEGATHGYEPFQGICLTDTFQLYEKGDLISNLLTNNSDRRKRQKALDIRVIMGNPPYSAGQDSANDNNQNVAYPDLDRRIRETYAAHSAATNNNALYDSYIRAIRWASDRVGKSGILGFVTNAGFLEARTADGLRKSLAEEFSSIYVFHLRGNARTSGEQRRKEKDNVFGQGTRTPIAITLLVKNPDAKQHGQIYWHDIGDYLIESEKLAIISKRC